MNRIAETLLDLASASPEQTIYTKDYKYISDIFTQLDSGADEQLAYFPLNPNNPIYKKNGIVPSVKTASVSNRIECDSGSVYIDGSLNNSDNDILLRFLLYFYLDENKKMNTYIATVTNQQALPGHKNKGTAARLINALQIFTVYSSNPGKLHLLTDKDGRYYWSKWFDFNYDADYRDRFVKTYAKCFEASLYGMGYHGTRVHNIVSNFQTPLDFRCVNEQLGVSNTNIGRTCMKHVNINWSGKCGLQEMSETGPIWEKSKHALLSRGIRPEYPDDFQKVVARKLSQEKGL